MKIGRGYQRKTNPFKWPSANWTMDLNLNSPLGQDVNKCLRVCRMSPAPSHKTQVSIAPNDKQFIVRDRYWSFVCCERSLLVLCLLWEVVIGHLFVVKWLLLAFVCCERSIIGQTFVVRGHYWSFVWPVRGCYWSFNDLWEVVIGPLLLWEVVIGPLTTLWEVVIDLCLTCQNKRYWSFVCCEGLLLVKVVRGHYWSFVCCDNKQRTNKLTSHNKQRTNNDLCLLWEDQ